MHCLTQKSVSGLSGSRGPVTQRIASDIAMSLTSTRDRNDEKVSLNQTDSDKIIQEIGNDRNTRYRIVTLRIGIRNQ